MGIFGRHKAEAVPAQPAQREELKQDLKETLPKRDLSRRKQSYDELAGVSSSESDQGMEE
jgi:hypothetical protein